MGDRIIPVTRGFDKTDVIGSLTLRDGEAIPLDSVFALGYIVLARAEDGTITSIKVTEVSLLSDTEYWHYLNTKEQKRKEE